jgi:hypothetical protein
MKRLVIPAVAALVVFRSTMAAVDAKGPPPEGGRAHGIGTANTRTIGPEETKITFSDLIVISGKPVDTGGND